MHTCRSCRGRWGLWHPCGSDQIALDLQPLNEVNPVLGEAHDSTAWDKAEVGTSCADVVVRQSEHTEHQHSYARVNVSDSHLADERSMLVCDTVSMLSYLLAQDAIRTPHVQAVAASGVDVAKVVAFD